MSRPRSATGPNLPHSAQARLARFGHATAHPSFLTVPAAYGVRAAGFEAVGDVMGCIAFQTNFEYLGRCGMTNSASTPRVVSPASGSSSTTSYLRQLSNAYRAALERLRAEATALGADGVVGLSLHLTRHEELREIVALGTAVRSTGRVRPDRLFTTDLPAPDVAKLMSGGWTPVEFHVAVHLALRHVDRRTMYEASPMRSNPNREVSGYSDLRQQVTARVRDQLRAQAARAGAQGSLLAELSVQHWHRRCMSLANGADLAGLATATGTSVARFAAPSQPVPAPLTILPVGRR